MEQLSSLRHESSMILAIVVPVKHGMAALMLVLKEEKIKAEAILVHINQRQNATKNPKDKC